MLSGRPAVFALTITLWCCTYTQSFTFSLLHLYAFPTVLDLWMKPGVRRTHHSGNSRFAQKGHRKLVGGSASHSHRKHPETLTNEAFRRETPAVFVNLQISCSSNFWCHFAYNYQPFVPGVTACRHSQFDTRAAAAELYGEEWKRVGGLLWNKNLISSQLGADLFVRQFSVSLMSSLILLSRLCDEMWLYSDCRCEHSRWDHCPNVYTL